MSRLPKSPANSHVVSHKLLSQVSHKTSRRKCKKAGRGENYGGGRAVCMSDLGDRPLTQSREDAEVRKVVLCGTLRLRAFASAF